MENYVQNQIKKHQYHALLMSKAVSNGKIEFIDLNTPLVSAENLKLPSINNIYELSGLGRPGLFSP